MACPAGITVLILFGAANSRHVRKYDGEFLLLTYLASLAGGLVAVGIVTLVGVAWGKPMMRRRYERRHHAQKRAAKVR